MLPLADQPNDPKMDARDDAASGLLGRMLAKSNELLDALGSVFDGDGFEGFDGSPQSAAALGMCGLALEHGKPCERCLRPAAPHRRQASCDFNSRPSHEPCGSCAAAVGRGAQTPVQGPLGLPIPMPQPLHLWVPQGVARWHPWRRAQGR